MSLSLAPGVAAGVIDPSDIVTVLAVGPSGAGKSLKTNLLASEILGSANPYAVGGTHRHIPEIRQALAAARASEIARTSEHPARLRRRSADEGIRISFTPVLVPMARGILATSHRADRPRRDGCRHPRRLGGGVRRRDVRAAAARRASSRAPPTSLGANTALMGLAIDRAANRVVVVTAVDNLVKGTAGAAVQSMNIALGLPEGTAPHRERSRAVSVTAPQGFEAAGVAVGLKSTGKPDVAVVVNRGPLKVGAAVFTSNRAKANPIIWSQQVIQDGVVEAIVLNSGGANCFTGSFGFQTTHQTAEKAAELLGVSAGDILICSTGLIGTGDEVFRAKVLDGTEQGIAALTADGGDDAVARHHDDRLRSRSARSSSGDGWTIGGMAKGAGMLAPGLATMLVVITTDAVLDAGAGRRRAAQRDPRDASTGSTPTAACRRTTR